MVRSAMVAAVIAASTHGALAQQMSVQPSGYDGTESACRVAGLKRSGDGFLAIRTGPSSNYLKVGEVYNGDVINMRAACRGRWCFADDIYRNGRRVSLHGWFHTNWCRVFAG